MTIGYQFQARLSVNPAPTIPVRGDVNLSSRYSNAPGRRHQHQAPGLLPGLMLTSYVLLFKMADGLQCPFFFWCQRYHA